MRRPGSPGWRCADCGLPIRSPRDDDQARESSSISAADRPRRSIHELADIAAATTAIGSLLRVSQRCHWTAYLASPPVRPSSRPLRMLRSCSHGQSFVRLCAGNPLIVTISRIADRGQAMTGVALLGGRRGLLGVPGRSCYPQLTTALNTRRPFGDTPGRPLRRVEPLRPTSVRYRSRSSEGHSRGIDLDSTSTA